jgi:hypothetical protein
MTVGDVVPYLWRDKGGFDYLRFEFDKDYNSAAYGEHRSATGCNVVKYLYGNNADHVTVLGTSAARMASSLCTPILRLADVYLVLAEAKVLLGQNSDADALKAYNAVHQRAIPSAKAETSLTFDKVWKERRLELACEGDRWYDFVRRSYYDVNACITELTNQRRNAIWGCNAAYKAFYESDYTTWDPSSIEYDTSTPKPNVTVNSFTLPYPTEDVALNPNLGSNVEPVHVDVRSEYSY